MQTFLHFAQAFHIAAKALAMYKPDHPRGAEVLTALETAARTLLDDRERMQIIVSHGRVFVDRKQIEVRGPHVAAFEQMLASRQLNGLILLSGVSKTDLQGIINLLNAKQQLVDQAGGPTQFLADAGVHRIRLSHVRYEELLDGEEIVDSSSVVTLVPGQTLGDTPMHVILNDLFRPLMQSIKRRVGSPEEAAAESETTRSAPLFDPRRIVPFDLEIMEKKLLESGLLNTPEFMEAFTQAIVAQDTEIQTTLLMSRETLPAGPLREVLDLLAPQLVLNIIGGLAQHDASPEGPLPDIVNHLYAQLQPRDRSLDRLRSRLDAMGVDRDELEELLEVLSWENLSPQAKMERLNDVRFLFELRMDRLLKFLRDLLGAGKHEEFVQLIERYGTGLFADSAELRRKVTEVFIRVLAMATSPGLSAQAETAIQRLMLMHFLKEPDKELQQRASDSVSLLVGYWMRDGRAERACRALNNLNSGVAASQLPWKNQAYEALLSQIAADHVPAIVPSLYAGDVDGVTNEVYPILTLLGAPAAAQLIDELAKEEDRSHRGRLVRAVKAIGRPALIPLRLAMQSTVWYLVRNALNLLGDLGGVELIDEVIAALHHRDGRVRRAAARALSKIGGERAEAELLKALNEEDTELQTEVLFCLANMKAENAIPVIAELTRSKRLGERAVETLGQIASPRAIAPLEELIRRKGLLSANETNDLRMAAARALAAINTPEAKLVIRRAAETEPNLPLREQMEKLLETAS